MKNQLSQHPNLYLRQHGENPIYWQCWSDETWLRAVQENKLVLVSIGYSACHWCHVMEKECFEDLEVGSLMNQYFICIKVDREERPDVDQVYMSALQAMGKNGGWPLNCICLPDGRPIFGGTYFPKERWLSILQELQNLFFNEYDTITDYANQLKDHLIDWENRFEFKDNQNFPNISINNWIKELDMDFGGLKGSPKFPMPPLVNFGLKIAVLENNSAIEEWGHHTLYEMSQGGLFDWIDGGFSRYSVDHRWHIPHFEKMLYDNAQLIETYHLANHLKPSKRYDHVIAKTFEWLEENLKCQNGLYYSAMDADSEGEEGKYYVWSQTELRTFLEKDFDKASQWFGFDTHSFWESDKIVLRLKHPEEEKNPDHFFSVLKKLQLARKSKNKPVTDTKILLGWNALLLGALAQIPEKIQSAVALGEQLKSTLQKNNLWKGGSYENRFIEDVFSDALAYTQRGYLKLFFSTSHPKWLDEALEIQTELDRHYRSPNSKFYQLSKHDTLFISTKDMDDHVVPSANAVIAESLYWMGILTGNDSPSM